MLHSITVRIILILLLHFTVWYYPTGRFTQGTFTQMIKEISCFSQCSVHSFSYKDNDTGWISAIATNLNWFVSDKVLQILIRGHSEMGFDGRTIIFLFLSYITLVDLFDSWYFGATMSWSAPCFPRWVCTRSGSTKRPKEFHPSVQHDQSMSNEQLGRSCRWRSAPWWRTRPRTGWRVGRRPALWPGERGFRTHQGLYKLHRKLRETWPFCR